MATLETVEAPAVSDIPVSQFNFSDALDQLNLEGPDDGGSEPAVTTSPPAEVPPVTTPDPPAPDPETPPATPPPPTPTKNHDNFKTLKAERDAARAEAATKATEAETLRQQIAEIQSSTATLREKHEQTEALKAEFEKRLTDYESEVVASHDVPYSIQMDPEAVPVLAAYRKAEDDLNHAVTQVAASLAEDQRHIAAISGHKAFFGQLMARISKGDTPDVVHAGELVQALSTLGITISNEDARSSIRELKQSVPAFRSLTQSINALNHLKAKNEPQWTSQQAARHAAYAREIAGAAEVPDDAADGDEAVLAGILKGKPEYRDVLKKEADRISAMVVGPAPGKATAASVKAAPGVLHRTAMQAARTTVVVAAYRDLQAEAAAKDARIAELEARIGLTNGSIPKPGNVVPKAPPDGRSFMERLAEVDGL